MYIGIPREIRPGEKRVATTPEVARLLIKLGYHVAIESGAGAQSAYSDTAYVEAGAEILTDVRELYRKSDIILKVRAPQGDVSQGLNEVELIRQGQILISFLQPAQNEALACHPGRARGDGAGHRRGTPDFPGPEDGCAQFHGQHCRLPGGC